MAKSNSGQLIIQCEAKRPRYINGKEIPNWEQGPSVAETVNYLNKKGWLLFSESPGLWLGDGKLTFIRPKQYLFVKCQEKRPRYINGKEIPNWEQGPTVSEAVFHLGRKGWVLYADTSAVWLGEGDLTFIRPIQ